MSASGTNRFLPAPAADAALLDWLLLLLRPMNRTRVKQLLRSGRVVVNGISVSRHNYGLKPADRIELLADEPPEVANTRHGLHIAYQDDALVAIDKQPGLLSVATEGEKIDTAFARLRMLLAARRIGRPFVVHRLDRETSGLLLFALTPKVRDQLQANWSKVSKRYLAVVEGVPLSRVGVVENYLTEGGDLRVRATSHASVGARHAVSRYRVSETRSGISLIEVAIETGRKHQIRVHLAGLGCPIIGDSVYGARTNPAGRLGLHAWKLAFDHPVTGKFVELESPLPQTLQDAVRKKC